MKSLNSFLLFLFISSPFFTFAQQMSLADALIYAEKNNSSLKDAYLNIADAEGQIVENKSIGLPKLNLGVDYTYNTQLPKSLIPETTFDPVNGRDGEFLELVFGLRQNFNAGLTANWLSLDGTYFYGLKAARLFRDFRQKELATVRKDVEDAVIEAYLPALIITENLAILDKNIANVTKLLKETTAFYEEGFLERLDVSRLELSLSNLNTEKDNLKRQREIVVNALKFALNYPLDEPLEIGDDLETLFVEDAPEELTEEMNYENRPEYITAKVGLQLNELNIKRYQAGYLPSLSLIGAYRQNWQGDKFNEGFWFPNSFVGASISMPIFDGFMKKAQIQRARVDLEKAQLQLNDLERGISLEVKNARTAYYSAAERLTNQNKNLELAELIYNDATIKYQEGIGSSVELIQAEQALFNTQRNRTQAMYDLLVAKKDLEQAFGK